MFQGGFGLAVVVAYLFCLVCLGWLGHRRRRPGSVSDFYLAGNTLGFFVLLATLYATQYSGNTFLGYPGQAYRLGFAWVMSIPMMMAVVIVYLLFAPRLHALAHRHAYVTPADWVRHRFGDTRLALLVSAVMVVTLMNYLYAQFLAMGHLAVSMSDGRLPFWAGVLALAFVIGLYETLGGMRSVAWTDVVQGVMLFVGLSVSLIAAWTVIGGLGPLTHELLLHRPELVRVPGWTQCANWLSSVLLVGVAAAVYPQAIQRIYAARDAATLRRSLQVMVCMPIPTLGIVALIGVVAHAVLPPQAGLATDRVMPEFLNAIAAGSTLGHAAAVIVLAAGLAAIMSTADSALLSLSSIITCDFVGQWRRRHHSEEALARFGKWISWALISTLVLLAARPPTTLWRLIEIKMELLIQTAPIIIIGLRSPHLDAATALRALATGTALAAAAVLAGIDHVGGLHAGVCAAAVNTVICLAGIRRNSGRRARVHPESTGSEPHA
jgi:SSS family solute:Na+ symporter